MSEGGTPKVEPQSVQTDSPKESAQTTSNTPSEAKTQPPPDTVTKDKRPAGHVHKQPRTIQQDIAKLKAESANLKKENANIQRTLKLRERQLKDATFLLGETMNMEEKQTEEAMYRSLQSSAQVRIEEPSSKRARSSSSALEGESEGHRGARASSSPMDASSSSHVSTPTGSASPHAPSAELSAGQSSSSGKGKEKAPASAQNQPAFKDFYANRHLLSSEEQFVMLDGIVENLQKKGILVDPRIYDEVQ